MNKEYKKVNARYRHIVGFVVMLMLLLLVRLFFLTMVEHDEWMTEASEQTTRTIYTPAPRGNIYDRNGVLLAGSRQIFTATFNASSLDTETINESSLAIINKFIENGDEYIDDFAIEIAEDGTCSYTFDHEQAEWLTSHGYDAGTDAETLFALMRDEYGIDPSLDRYEAMQELTEKHRVYVPINERTMKYVFRQSLENFWNKFGFSGSDTEGGMDAGKCFAELRKDYRIDPALSDSEARKIFIIRDKIANYNAQRYIPITIATDICDSTVIYIEESGIAGVEVVPSTERYYPYKSSACHLIGYMGAISEEEADYYDKLGYLQSEMVGKDGIEAAMEETLHGAPGVKTVRVNSSGEYVRTIDDKPASKGKDVYSTIDIKLQQETEQALAEAVANTSYGRSGALLVEEVKTGDILAMASYPGFDINAFADGISNAEWAAVQPENPREAFSPTPLFNNATRAAVAPGSTFKPLTSIAALKCGLDPDLMIWDKGHIDIGGMSFGCFTYNNYGVTDGWENLEWGIGNSCNYYFACIATGKDWSDESSLGYDISIDDIIKEAQNYGLGKPTGIEIGETVSRTISAETKMENYRVAVWSAIYNKAHTYFPPEVYNDYDRLSKNITRIADKIYENPAYSDLIEWIDENTEVADDQVESCASMVKFDYFIQAAWTDFDVFNVSIGQGDNTYTPVQVANYIATIGNNGIRNKVSVIYGVEGRGRTVKPEPFDTGTTPEERSAVLKGMRRVCLSGTLSSFFSDYPIEVVGKTGTAQYQGIKQPEDEVSYVKAHLSQFNSAAGANVTWEQVEAKIKELMLSDADLYPTDDYAVDQALVEVSDHMITQVIINSYKETYEDFSWVVAMAPADDPEIVAVLMIPEGGLASEAGGTVRKIMDAYFRPGASDDSIYVATEDNGSNKAD